MKLVRILIVAAIAVLLPRSAPAGEASADSAAAQTISIPPPGFETYAPPATYFRDSLDPTSSGHLNLSLSMSAMSWYTPPTRFDAALNGAGRAATLGMFLGAIGNTLGWFDEETTWWMTGSLAAVGAVYAGAKYEPQPGVRLRWSVGEDDRR
jgi:hypothetical protein